MRRIFPLKSGSAGGGNQHGQQPAGAGSTSAPTPQKENARMKGTPVASRYAPELSKKATANRSRRTEASTSEDLNLNNGRATGGSSKREHWCPACPPPVENGARCDTPPSGDENNENKEVEKSVISCPTEETHKARSRSPSGDLDSASGEKEKLDSATGFDSVISEVMRARERLPSANKYSSKRSGLGAVDNLVHERHNVKPLVKPKATTNATPTIQEETARATLAQKSRLLQNRGVSQSGSPRVQSMRILKVSDGILESSSLSSTDSTRASDASSSTGSRPGSPTTRSTRNISHERERLKHPPPVKTQHHSRAQSFSEGLGSNKPPPQSPSYARKSTDSPRSTKKEPDSPRIARKELAQPSIRKELLPSAIPPAPGAALSAKGQTSKYSGARVVAERLAKAFRGTSKTKDEKPTSFDEGERSRAKLGQSKRMSPQAEEIADSSYDGSCSDTSSLQTGDRDDGAALTNVLQLARPGNRVLSQRKDSSGSTGTTGESALSWQEFIKDGRVPQGLSNDHPTPENGPDSSQVSKNSGASTGSRRWGSAAANESNRSPSHKMSSSPSRQDKESSRQEKEREVSKGWLGGLKRQSEGMTDDLDMKVQMAEQRVSVLNGEQSFESQDILHDLGALEEDGNSNIAEGINIMQQRIKRMHEEKKRLALEVASEVKRRITERAAAKEVLVMMKREMEACVRVMEREKMGIQAGFERELERRENEWHNKLENTRLEEKWLRERVRRLEEDKGGLQSELGVVAAKEDSLREKVKDFELQMEGHRKRVEGAEKTILDLRHSLVSSCQQARQAESELENVRQAYLERESQSQELAKQVGRLQQLCADQESSIEGLREGLLNGGSEFNEQKSNNVRMELVRLSTVEKTLREELEALKNEAISWQGVSKDLVDKMGRVHSKTEMENLDHKLQAELASLQSRITQLQEENRVLAAALEHAEEERDSARKVLKNLESNLAGVEEDSKILQDEVGREKNSVQEREREIHRLERRVDGLLKNNQMLQGILAMREKAALICDEEAKEKEKAVKDAHQLEAEMRESLQVSARQLAFMNERAELMSEKIKERDAQLTAVKNECGKKDDVIRGLEQSLSDLARSMDAQNRRIMQLSNTNGELSRLLQARGKEVKDRHSKIAEDGQISPNPEMDQISVQAYDVKQELEAQNLLCKLLRDKLAQSEDDLSKRSEEVAGLIRSRDWFQAELQRAQSSLGEASHRLATLERTVKQKEEVISLWEAEKQGYLRDISNLKDDLPQVEREREEMRAEADEIGREALRLSAQVEVLRRKVAQLEEDVLVKEGQISILRGSCFGASE